MSNVFREAIEALTDHDASLSDYMKALDTLHFMERAANSLPGLVDELGRRVNEADAASRAEYAISVAESYLREGCFDDAGEAYYHLYFREARKGLGIRSAIAVAEAGLRMAHETNRVDAVDALSRAIPVLKGEKDEDVELAARRLVVAGRLALSDLLAA